MLKIFVVLLLLISSIAVAQTKTIIFLDDTITYNQEELQQFAQDYPELTGKTLIHPDSSYVISEQKTELELSCEVCKDNYYLIYTYYLYHKNDKSLDTLRNKLISAYRTINAINKEVKGEGTHFGHMYSRLYAVVEYDIANSINGNINSDFTTQKKAFIESLKQRVYDSEELRQYGTAPRESIYKQLLISIDSLDKEINRGYVLNCVMEFDDRYY